MVIFVVTSVLSLLLVGVLRWLSLRADWLVIPGHRDSHLQPTPTGAGLAMVLALVAGTVLAALLSSVPGWWLYHMLPAMLLLSAMGWWDDRHRVPWKARLLIQAAVSLTLLMSLANGVPDPWSGAFIGFSMLPALLTGFLLLLYVVWTMNAYNFMDGSDGMAAGQGVFASLMLAWLCSLQGADGTALAALLLAAVCLGYLPWNIPVARIFMGDSGSIPLGFSLAMLCLVAAQQGVLPLPALLLLLAAFLVDASLTLLVRVIRGERWYTAHRQHLYQKLVDSGWSHTRVLMLYQGINCLVIAPSVWWMAQHQPVVWPLTGTLIMLLVAAWSIASLKLGVKLEGQ